MRAGNNSVIRSRIVCGVLALSIVLCAAGMFLAVAARAAGGSGFRSPEAAALGLDSSTHALVFLDPDPPRERWWVEAGQRRLFDLDDLVSNGAEVGVRSARFGLVVSSLIVSSPIGAESRYFASLMYLGSRRVRVATGLGADVAALDGFETAGVFFAAASAVVELSETVRLISTIDRVRIAGDPDPGADVSAAVVLFPGAVVSALAGLALTRHGVPCAGFGARIRFSHAVSAAAGYDEGAGMLKGSVSVCVRSVGVHVGAGAHSVLGVSKAVFVSWRR